MQIHTNQRTVLQNNANRTFLRINVIIVGVALSILFIAAAVFFYKHSKKCIKVRANGPLNRSNENGPIIRSTISNKNFGGFCIKERRQSQKDQQDLVAKMTTEGHKMDPTEFEEKSNFVLSKTPAGKY